MWGQISMDISKKKMEKVVSLYPDEIIDTNGNINVKPIFAQNHTFVWKNESVNAGNKTWRFLLTDCSNGNSCLLFDHQKLATALIDFAGEYVNPEKLNIKILSVSNAGIEIQFCKMYFILKNNKLFQISKESYSISPNKSSFVIIKDFNLVLVDTLTGKGCKLTNDGQKYFDYASRFEGDLSGLSDRISSTYKTPCCLWSPDGNSFITYKLDQRNVRDITFVRSAEPNSITPQVYSFKYTFPFDKELPNAQLVLFKKDVNCIKLDLPLINAAFMTPVSEMSNCICFSDTGRKIFVYIINDNYSNISVYSVDVSTGKTHKLFTEKEDKFIYTDFHYLMENLADNRTSIEPCFMRALDSRGEFIWLSGRDGWFHLYLYDAETGKLIRKITSGEFNVNRIEHVDSQARLVYVSVSGLARNPYDNLIVAFSLDRDEYHILTPEEGNHIALFDPEGDFFLDTVTQCDMPPVGYIRKVNGEIVKQYYKANISAFKQNGGVKPIRFNYPGSDGITNIFGMILLPENAKKAGKIPLVEYYYGGNQLFNVPNTFFSMINCGFMQSICALGMACVVIDGMGTPGRSREFHEKCFQNIGDCAGLEDHITVIKKLLEKYPFLDKTRIGVWGHSGGGFATVNCLMKYSEIYSCGVASSGNYYQDMYWSEWGKRFMRGYDKEKYDEQNVQSYIEKLKGKLLLIHGDMDDNVFMYHTIRLADALVKANKVFDMFIIPNANHQLKSIPYFRHRVLGYLAKELLSDK